MQERVGVPEVVRFATELVALAASYVVAAHVGDVAAGLVAAIGFVLVWGGWFAPKSAHRLDDPVRLVAEVCLFGGLGAALVAVGHPIGGTLLAVIGVGDAFVVRRGQRGSGRSTFQ